jgi:hypothetical protein
MGLPAGLSSCPNAKTIREWLWRNIPAFISAEDWPSGSPDLNPRDYKLWDFCGTWLAKRSVVKAAAEIPLETVRSAIAEWTERLMVCIEAEGGHFEWHCYKQKLKSIVNKLFGSKSGYSVSFSF